MIHIAASPWFSAMLDEETPNEESKRSEDDETSSYSESKMACFE
jgi:hypothetical protein